MLLWGAIKQSSGFRFQGSGFTVPCRSDDAGRKRNPTSPFHELVGRTKTKPQTPALSSLNPRPLGTLKTRKPSKNIFEKYVKPSRKLLKGSVGTIQVHTRLGFRPSSLRKLAQKGLRSLPLGALGTGGDARVQCDHIGRKLPRMHVTLRFASGRSGPGQKGCLTSRM